MKISDFQFSNPCLTGLEFKINSEFEKGNSEEISMANTFNVNVSKSETGNEAMVSLVIEINKDMSNHPFYLKAEIGAAFLWNESMEEELVEKMLSQNAPALLLSYARPIVAMVTRSSPFPSYDLPFFNFTIDSDEETPGGKPPGA